MKTLTLLPLAGLCNRMRAIASAKRLIKYTGHKLRIIWVHDDGLSAHFKDLFEKDDNCDYIELKRIKPNLLTKLYIGLNTGNSKIPLVNKIHKCKFSKTYQNVGYDAFNIKDIEKISLLDNIFISSHSPFFQSEKNSYSCFIPTTTIRNKVLALSKNFNSSTYGLHIRRSDNEHSISNSPLSAFIKIIRHHLKNEPAAIFFLASDCKEVKEELILLFPEKIVYQEIQPTRSSLIGMHDAMIDLYLLSRCTLLYGSYWSSFSETAAAIGDIEYVTVTDSSEP